MKLSDLQIFSTVVQEGGVTRASKRLYRVQSNVTKRIHQLESDLGVPLFVREGKRMHLTPAGQILLEYTERLLSLAQEARAAVQDTAPRGVFRLGSMESTAAVRLPAFLTEYHRHYPDVKLELKTGNPTQLATSLLAREIEAALVAELVAAAQFESIVAFKEELVIVTSRDYPPIKKIGNAPETMIVFEYGCPHRRRFEEWYASRGEMPVRTIELGSYHAILACVLAGMGATLLPKSILSTFPESKRLNILPLPRGNNCLNTLLIWRKGLRSAKVKALADMLMA